MEFKEEVLALERTISNTATRQVVFYGSSSIRLWESLYNDFDQLNCLNLAFGGSTIQDCIDNYQVLLKKTTPSQIVFYAGDNDLGQGVSVEDTYRRFVQFYGLVRADFPNTPFVFISVKPSLARVHLLDSIRELNARIVSFLSNEKLGLYVDVFSDMMEGDQIRTDLFVEDQLHMNKKGYAIWSTVLKEYLIS